MKEITPAITEIKSKVSMQDWQQRILDCQSSGMSVKAWCRENGFADSAHEYSAPNCSSRPDELSTAAA